MTPAGGAERSSIGGLLEVAMGIARRLMSGAGAFLVGGLLIWAMAWVIDLNLHLQRVAVDPGGHSHGGGDALIRINFPMTGFPLILVGMGSLLGLDRLLYDRRAALAFFAGVLFAVDGLAHAFAFNDHINEPYAAALFAVVAPAQILIGVAMPFLSRRFDPVWLLAALGLLAVYVVSRTVYFPALNMPEAVDGLGIFSKVLEVAFIWLTLLNIRAGAQPAAAKPRPSPGGSSSEPQQS